MRDYESFRNTYAAQGDESPFVSISILLLIINAITIYFVLLTY